MTREEFEKDLLRQAKKESIRALASNDKLDALDHKKQASKIKALVKRIFHMTGKIEHADITVRGGYHHE